MINQKALAGRSLPDLFAYAHDMERQAALRYEQLADMMVEHCNTELADLFKHMAQIEWRHVDHVDAIGRELSVPSSDAAMTPGQALIGAELPVFEDMHYLHRPRQALVLARGLEEDSARFYEELASATDRNDVREAALRFAEVERAHIQELDRWLARYPAIEAGWDEDPDPPNEPS